jgi:hypothetical protein
MKRGFPIKVDELGEGLTACKFRDILGTNWQVANHGKRAGKGAYNRLGTTFTSSYIRLYFLFLLGCDSPDVLCIIA